MWRVSIMKKLRMRRDPSVPIRLIDLLSSGIPARERSLSHLAALLDVSKGCLEYHIRQLRQSGDIERDPDGVLHVLTRRRQLPLGLNFNPDNVRELSAARAHRRLSDDATSYCDLVIQLRVPASRSAAEITDLLTTEFGARDLHIFVETPANSSLNASAKTG